MKWLDILLAGVSILFGLALGIMAAHAGGLVHLNDAAVQTLLTTIATVLGAALGAAIAVDGALKAAQRQVNLQRQHDLDDRKNEQNARLTSIFVQFLPVYNSMYRFTNTVVTEDTAEHSWSSMVELSAQIEATLDLTNLLQPGDSAFPLWPNCHYQLRSTHRVISSLPQSIPVSSIPEFIHARHASVRETALALRTMLQLVSSQLGMSADQFNQIVPAVKTRDIAPTPVN
ncbi:hypothetical protein [Ferrovibrio sp.]|uniref:hypothetical protein n=1 Tax=Ferrovibrio sp. TaxID=1917215 RepID=UPI0025BE3CE1|nr:hypothetical protein [Ferrovibrio sp.]